MDERLVERLGFDNVPEIYDLARPEYPAAAYNELWAYAGLEDAPEPRVLEIGPGTGKATGALLARGAILTAVEIGPRLASFLRAKFAGEPRLSIVNAAFEDVDLPASTFDLIFAATAFHWLDPEVAVPKCHQLLCTAGVLATVSTMQVRSDVDRGYFARTQDIYERWGEARGAAPSPGPDDATPAEYDALRESSLFGDLTIRRYRWDQTYSTDGYEALLRSYSGTNSMAAEAREGLIHDLRDVIDNEYGGTVTRPLVIVLTMARREP